MVSRLKNKISTSVRTGRFNVFLLFLFLALIILLLTKLTKVHTKSIAFQVQVTNQPEELVLINSDSLNLDVTLKTQGYKLMSYYFKTPKIQFNFDDLNKLNDSIYYWQRSSDLFLLKNNFKSEEEIQLVKPEKLYFRYDINSVKKIPVVLNAKVSFAQGFDLLGNFELVPDSITVVGPKSEVSILKAIQTDTLVLANVNANISKKIGLLLPDDDQKVKISDKRIEVHGTVDKFSEGTVKVPIGLKNVPDNLKITTYPKEVTVTFYTSLSNFNKVKAQDFKVECDYGSVSPDKQFLRPKLVKKPDIVKNARVNQDRIEFILN